MRRRWSRSAWGRTHRAGATSSSGSKPPRWATEHTWTSGCRSSARRRRPRARRAALERRLEQGRGGGARLDAAAGPGRTQFTTGWELERAVTDVLAEHDVEGLLEVSWKREETSRTRYVGRGRGGPNRPTTTEWTIRYQITEVRRNEAGDPAAGGAAWAGGAGEQFAGGAAVAGGGGAGLPRGLVCGAGFPRVEGRAVGDPPAVRAAGRPGPGPDPSGDAGVAGADAVRGAGAPRPGAEPERSCRGCTPVRRSGSRTARRRSGCWRRSREARITLTQLKSGDEVRWHLTPLPSW